jgi:hypothetical protein
MIRLNMEDPQDLPYIDMSPIFPRNTQTIDGSLCFYMALEIITHSNRQ